ncbi:MAG: hypothetical protein ACRD2W_14790 [Acidimicrobiales bacterium]
MVAWAHGFRVIYLLRLGRRAEAEGAAKDLPALGQDLHCGYARWGAAVLKPVFAHLDGRFDESLVLAEEARDLRRSAFNSHLYDGIQRILTHREQGRLEEVEGFMVELVGRLRENNIVGSTDVALNAALALPWCELGNLARGRTMFDKVVAMGIPNSVDDPARSAALSFLTDVSVALGDLRLAPASTRCSCSARAGRSSSPMPSQPWGRLTGTSASSPLCNGGGTRPSSIFGSRCE